MKKTQQIGLEDFTDWQGEVSGVEIDSRFYLPPYAPAEAISVDVSTLASIANFGRLAKVRLRTYSEEADTTFSVQSVNLDGTATVGAVKEATIARTMTSITREDGDATFPKSDSLIRINLNHPDLDNASLRQPDSWARLIDRGMREGLRDASKKQLLEPKRDRRVRLAAYNCLNLIIPSVYVAMTNRPEYFAFWAAYSCVDDATGISARIADKVLRRPRKDTERSLILHYPLDRYFAVRALTTTKKIVKPRQA